MNAKGKLVLLKNLPKEQKRLKKDYGKKVFLLCFILPAFTIYSVFYIYPFLYAFYISLFEWRGYSRVMKFVGLKNFKRLLTDEIVLIGIKNNLFFLLWSTVIIFVLSLFFAVCITRLRLKWSSFYKIVFFFPNVLSIIVVGILWMFIYNPSFGLLNAILKSVGLGGWIQDWLGDESVVMSSLVAPQSWMFIGFYMILFIASIQSIPEEYYESSIIDGAGQIRQFFNITIPLIWGTVRISLIFFVVNAFSQTFSLVYVVTKGGPNRASELLTTYLYEQAFKNSNYGYGTAIGVVLFLLMCIISLVTLKVTKREELEY